MKKYIMPKSFVIALDSEDFMVEGSVTNVTQGTATIREKGYTSGSVIENHSKGWDSWDED